MSAAELTTPRDGLDLSLVGVVILAPRRLSAQLAACDHADVWDNALLPSSDRRAVGGDGAERSPKDMPGDRVGVGRVGW